MRRHLHIAGLPTIPEALERCRRAGRWNQAQMARELGIGRGHYSEILKGERRLSYRGACEAFRLGVAAVVLLSVQNLRAVRFPRSPPSSP